MIIAVCNQKGGVGKTATAQAIATGAAFSGLKSLAIDLDAQGNLSFSMGGNSADKGVFELLTGKATPAQVIQHTEQGDIITASADLSAADSTFRGTERGTALKDAIRPIKKKYDVITIDCPPSLNTLLINALVAADLVIVPLTADMYAVQGLYNLKQTIEWAQQHNKSLKIGGILFTRHNTRTIIGRDLTDLIEEKCQDFGMPVYKTRIRDGVAIREAQTYRMSIFEYAPRAKVTQDYKLLLEEIGLH